MWLGAADHDVFSTRQGTANGFVGFAPHDNGFAHGNLFEVLEVRRQVPRELIFVADDAFGALSHHDGYVWFVRHM